MTEESQQAASVGEERDREILQDPEAVFVNMKRGTIAKPSLRSMIELYAGEVLNGEDALQLENARLRAALSQVGAEVVKCVWTRDEDTDAYDTECGSAWHLTDGGAPGEHGQYYCHHCGKPIDDGESGE